MQPNFTDYNKLDTARWVAALAVVLLHSAAAVLITADSGSKAWHWANVYDAATRWCVPVFVMISGALLLDPNKQENLKRFYRRRAQRILPATLFWSIFYLLWTAWQYRLQGVSIDAQAWLRQATGGEPYYHLWYLYMLIGLLLCAPFVRQFYRYCSSRQRVIVLVLLFVLAMLLSAYRELQANGYGFFLFWFVPYLSYFWAGRMLIETSLRLSTAMLVVLLLLSMVLTVVGTNMLSTTENLNYYFYDNFSLTVPVMSLAAFYLLLNTRCLPNLSALASYTFGIYLVHPFFLDLAIYGGFYAVNNVIWWQIPLVAIMVFIISVVAVWALRHLPGGVKLS